MASVLIIDDQTPSSQGLGSHLRDLGHRVTFGHTLADGFQQVLSGALDVVYLNPRMPDGNGLDWLPKMLAHNSHPEIIILTDSANPDEAEAAIQHGAWDYIERTSNLKALAFPLFRALQYRAKKTPRPFYTALKRETFAEIISNSPQMKPAMDLLAQAAKSDANVLLSGETGTGKELFAWAIHNNSSRADKNFVVVDCASLPETLVESTLFGHERGAYTGAEKSQIGLVKQADGGTLFLDEVSQLPPSIQGSFLRVLQERKFRPVGGVQEVSSDFRLIAATNQNLGEMVQKGEFRKDLLFRLQTITLELPPLRNRPEDIKYLAIYHISALCERYGIGMKEFSVEFLEVLMNYHWPGNVRELVNALEKAIIAARYEPILYPKHLPTQIRIQVVRDSASRGVSVETVLKGGPKMPQSLPTLKEYRSVAMAQMEKKYLQDLVNLTGGNISEAMRVSGLSRSRLYGLLKKYQLSAP
jgi:two-component system, NtrC family, response regulator